MMSDAKMTAGGRPVKCPCQAGPVRRRSRKHPGHYMDCKRVKSGDLECKGHPAGPYDPMGQTIYCDGSCR